MTETRKTKNIQFTKTSMEKNRFPLDNHVNATISFYSVTA